jgi:hypothetical protein
MGNVPFTPGGVSSEDLRRIEIANVLAELHEAHVPDEDVWAWQTLGDVVRSMIAHTERQPWEPPLTVAEVWPKVQQLITNVWYIHP